MRRTIFLAVLLALGSLGLCGQARADQLYLSNVGNNFYYGVFAGPYTAQMSDGSTIPIVCDDFNTTVTQGWTWTATSINFSDPTFLKDVKFGQSASLTGYSQMINYFAAAYLAQEIMANLSNTAMVDQLSFALWGIFSSSARLEWLMDPQARKDYLAALAYAQNANASDFANVEFWVPSPTGSSQEYITILATPEPSKWVLLLCGALLLVVIKIKHLLV